MRKITILSIPFFTVCIVLLFSFNVKTKAQVKMGIRDEFEKTITQSRFVEWFNSGQIDSISIRYLENACLMPDQYPTLTNREGINDYFEQLYKRGLRFSKVKTISSVISDSIAVERGVWEVIVDSRIIATGSYLTQWHYINGKWWIENDMSNSDHIITRID